MSISPIAMFGASFKCTRCRAGMGKCGCWEPITLRCPACGRTQKATRELSDPIGAKTVTLKCPECWDATPKENVG